MSEVTVTQTQIDVGGTTVEIPTNWQARKLLDYAREKKENADTKASASHWSQLEYRLQKSLEDDNAR